MLNADPKFLSARATADAAAVGSPAGSRNQAAPNQAELTR
jgi:hypothetical protein